MRVLKNEEREIEKKVFIVQWTFLKIFPSSSYSEIKETIAWDLSLCCLPSCQLNHRYQRPTKKKTKRASKQTTTTTTTKWRQKKRIEIVFLSKIESRHSLGNTLIVLSHFMIQFLLPKLLCLNLLYLFSLSSRFKHERTFYRGN